MDLASSSPSSSSTDATLYIPGPITDPTDIPGLLHWFDGQDGTTITDSGVGTVEQWDDKGRLGADVSQSSEGRRPGISSVNDNDGILVDGTDDLLISEDIAAYDWTGITAMCAVTPDNIAGGNGEIIRMRTDADIQFRFTLNNARIRATHGNSSLATVLNGDTALVADQTEWSFVRFRPSNDGTSDLQDSIGSSDSLATDYPDSFPTSTDISVGSITNNNNNVFHGHLHEIIVYDRYLLDVERDALIAYMESRWSFGAPQFDIASSSASQSDTDAALAIARDLSSSASSSSDTSAAMDTSKPLASAASSSSVSAAALQLAVQLSASAAATSDASAGLETIKHLSAAASSISETTAFIEGNSSLSSAAAGLSTSDASILLSLNISAVITAQSGTSAQLNFGVQKENDFQASLVDSSVSASIPSTGFSASILDQ